MPFIETTLVVLGLYLLIGACFAIAFVTFGVQRVDEDARGSGVWFRLAILPGVTLLWPLLAIRWLRGADAPAECTAHKRLAREAQR